VTKILSNSPSSTELFDASNSKLMGLGAASGSDILKRLSHTSSDHLMPQSNASEQYYLKLMGEDAFYRPH